MNRVRTSHAFTIVELLIVVVIIAILATITIIAYNGIQARAQLSAVRSDVATITKQIENYKTINSVYPGSITDCPSPAAANICYPISGGRTVSYAAIAEGSSSEATALTSSASYEMRVQAGSLFTYTSPAEKTAAREFMQYTDLAPMIDKYGLVPYVLSFDIKSANTTTNNTMQVYLQNGSSARYTFQRSVPVTTSFTHQEITVTPTASDSAQTRAMLAFYGSYNTGNIPTVRDVQIGLK